LARFELIERADVNSRSRTYGAPKLFIWTSGAWKDGARLAGGRQCTAPARPVEVIDAVRAGDSFNVQATPGNCVDTSAPVGNASRDDQDQ
jgi:hypothetical protein